MSGGIESGGMMKRRTMVKGADFDSSARTHLVCLLSAEIEIGRPGQSERSDLDDVYIQALDCSL